MRPTDQQGRKWKEEPFYCYLVEHEDLLRKALSKCQPQTVDFQFLSGLLQLTMQEIENYREAMGFPLPTTARLNPAPN